MEYGMKGTIESQMDLKPFDDMEDLGDGLYSAVISGFRGTDESLSVLESDNEDLVFGHIDPITPIAVCADNEPSLWACVDMILIQYGIDALNDWQNSEGVGSIYDAIKILENCGLDVEWLAGEDADSLMNLLDEGNIVLCKVNDVVLNMPEMADLPLLDANHMVNVIGIDFTNPVSPKAIMNDPYVEGGRRVCSFSSFLLAWKNGNNMMMVIKKGKL